MKVQGQVTLIEEPTLLAIVELCARPQHRNHPVKAAIGPHRLL